MFKRNPGESLDEWDARMRDAWERQQATPKTVAEMNDTERRDALAEIMRPKPRPVVAPFDGKHLRDMSPHERQRAAEQLGLSHVFPSFR